LFEICVKRFFAFTSEKFLMLARGLDRRLFVGRCPLAQFTASCNTGGLTQFTNAKYFKGGFLGEEVVQKIEANESLTIEYMRELTAHEIGYLLNHSERGKDVKRYIRTLPLLDFEFVIRPITGNIVNFDIELRPKFDWSDRWHGSGLNYWLWVDDGYSIMHVEHFVLHKTVYDKNERPTLSFAVPVPADKRNEYYFVRIYGEHWAGVDLYKEADMSKIVLPQDDVQHTTLLDLLPLKKSVLQNPIYESLYSFEYFNPI
jgi:hypothetical protein